MSELRLARRPYLVILALVVAELVAIFEGGMIYAAIGKFYEVFGDPIAVGWTLTAFFLASASTAVVFGRLGDLYGRKRIALILLILSIIGSVVSATATDITLVIVGRALQGTTSAILPISYGLMREHLSRKDALVGIGTISAVLTVGSGIGVFLGGLIVDLLSWRWIFIFSAVVAALAFMMVHTLVPKDRQSSTGEKIDYVGAILFMVPTTILLYAISSADEWGWTDGRALGLIGTSFAVFVFWVFFELRHAAPLVDIRLLTKRQPLLANFCMMMMAMGTLQATAFLMLLLQQSGTTGSGLGLSATRAGLIMLLPLSMGLIGGPMATVIANRSSARNALICALLFITAGWLGVASHHSTVWFIFVMMMAVGMGQAMGMAAVPMLILEVAPQERTSEATAIITSLRPTAMGIGVQISSYLIALYTIENPAGVGGSYVSEQGFLYTFSFVASASLVGLLAALFLPSRYPDRAPVFT